jgi:uncharacterized membrane protein
MRALIIFLRATFVGGVLFLLPIVVLALVLGEAEEIARPIVAPLVSKIAMQSMAGVPMATILALGVIVLFCFCTGLFARTRLARRMAEGLESVFLYNVPGYDFFKGISESLMGYETRHTYQVVLARIEEAWQIGFVTERLESGHYAVFVPRTPEAWSGSVYLMTEDRFRRVDISRAEAVKCLRRLGLGANQLFGRRIGGQAVSSGDHRQEAQAIS